jgi:lysophospholipid acyltransferase (LPLAT)-like uncharacterized protein
MNRTWDRFVIPCPLGGAALMFGPALSVPKDATEDDLETLAAELTQRLNVADSIVDAAVGL